MIGKRKSNARGRREDGASTKSQLLEAAGVLFGEKGLDRTTAKEIAERAGANAAAVNYYYGGIEGLYEEVLVEAHHRLMSYQALADIVAGDVDPKHKLRELIEFVVSAFRGPASSSWAVRVISREFLSPSPYIHVLRQKEIEPKKSLFFGVVSELLGLPQDHPAVARSCFSIAAPCMVLLLADRLLTTQSFPLGAEAMDTQALADHMVQFALGGLAALAKADAIRSS